MPWRFSPVAPRADASFTAHALSPAAVLEMYRRAVGPNPPPSYLLCVRGEAFELEAAPSTAARANAEAAFQLLCRLCADARPGAWERAAREAPAGGC